MKLSMWMIANRLSPLMDITMEIDPDAKPTLNSARLVYATNCVHVYEENGSVICTGEGDRIRMSGITLKEAFEIVQGVFDYFQDWEEMIRELLQKNDFQNVLNECEILFQNPALIMDANNKVLAMSKNVDPMDMDQEWRYLMKYGYSSLDSVYSMNYFTTADFMHNGLETYHFHTSQPQMRYDGITYNLQFDEVYCGRITILQKEREVNPGDFQLLEKIASYISPILGAPSYSEAEVRPNVFYDLLFGSHRSEQELAKQMEYYHWSMSDSYQAAVLMPAEQEKPSQSLKLIQATISRQLPRCVVLVKTPYIVVLHNRPLSGNADFQKLLHAMGNGRSLWIGYSLVESGPMAASMQYLQGVSALRYGRKLHPGRQQYYFSDYGARELLDTQDPAGRLAFCHPQLRMLWQRKQESGDALYDTLKIYLDQERSLNKTAERLFTHRNTVLYRIKRCQEILGEDLDNPEVRCYLRLSMYYIGGE